MTEQTPDSRADSPESHRPFHPETQVVDLGRPPRTHDAALNPPIVVSSTFIGSGDINGDDYAYGRYGNPTWDPFESAVAALEDARLPGIAFASGLAAITAALDVVAPGGTVIMPEHCYLGALTGAQETAATGRFDLVTVPIDDTGEVVAALRSAVSRQPRREHGAGHGEPVTASPSEISRPRVLLWIESPTNPMLEVADLTAIIAAAKEAGATVCVDNTFATPLVQRPLELGADMVVHSATKYLAGHSDVVLGIVITGNQELHEHVEHYRSIHGGIPGPFETWLALRGLRTMALRVERSMASAQVLAERLEELADKNGAATGGAGDGGATGHGLAVRYPGLPRDPGHERAAAQMEGFGSILSIDLGSAQAATIVAESVRLWTPATSLGGVESLIERRRRHAEEPTSVPEGLLRLSVGIENVEDLWDDLSQALAAAGIQ